MCVCARICAQRYTEEQEGRSLGTLAWRHWLGMMSRFSSRPCSPCSPCSHLALPSSRRISGCSFSQISIPLFPSFQSSPRQDTAVPPPPTPTPHPPQSTDVPSVFCGSVSPVPRPHPSFCCVHIGCFPNIRIKIERVKLVYCWEAVKTGPFQRAHGVFCPLFKLVLCTFG